MVDILSDIITHLDTNHAGLPYDYSPIIHRKRIKWPNNARVAFWVVPNIEHWVTDMPGTMISPMNVKPDIHNFSWRDYSLRVGLWRMMKVMDKHGVRGTVALNSSVCKYYPTVIEECKKRNWEFMGHGISNSWRLAGLDLDLESRIVREVVETIERATGHPPEGWLSPGLTESENTLSVLTENGIKYVCDWCNDDQPYPMKANGKMILSVPYGVEINDIPMYLQRMMTGQEFYQTCIDTFDTLYEEGKETGKVMCMGLHPYVTGQPFRAKYFDKILRYIVKHEYVWVSTGSEIANWFTQKCM